MMFWEWFVPCGLVPRWFRVAMHDIARGAGDKLVPWLGCRE